MKDARRATHLLAGALITGLAMTTLLAGPSPTASAFSNGMSCTKESKAAFERCVKGFLAQACHGSTWEYWSWSKGTVECGDNTSGSTVPPGSTVGSPLDTPPDRGIGQSKGSGNNRHSPQRKFGPRPQQDNQPELGGADSPRPQAPE